MSRKNTIIIFLIVIAVSSTVAFYLYYFFNVKNEPGEPTGQTKPMTKLLPQEIIDRLSATLTDPYSIKDGKIYYQDALVEGADIATFELLRSGYARDARTAYYASKSIPSADLATFSVLGDGYAEDKNQLYQSGVAIFDLNKGENPLEQGAARLKEFTPKDDTAIDIIIATYYDLMLFYGNSSEYSIFDKAGDDYYFFFVPLFKELKQLGDYGPRFEAFRLAFVDPNSPAFLSDLSLNAGPCMGGEVVGRKLLDPDTMLVYAVYGWQSYLGPPAGMCKEANDIIDKFIFKKAGDEWKIWEIEEMVDRWTTHEEGSTKEECKEINQDKIEKYRMD